MVSIVSQLLPITLITQDHGTTVIAIDGNVEKSIIVEVTHRNTSRGKRHFEGDPDCR